MTLKQKYKVGDIFAIEIASGEYAYGRILLDIYGSHKKKSILEDDSYLHVGFDDTVLVEIYKETGLEHKLFNTLPEVLISSLFVTAADIKLTYWKIIGHKDVDPTKIDFPEFVIHNGALGGRFIKGEISTAFDMEWADITKIKVPISTPPSINIPQMILNALGRTEEIDFPKDKRSFLELGTFDLRYSENKKEVYALLPDEFKKNYYEMARDKGFDLIRLYQ